MELDRKDVERWIEIATTKGILTSKGLNIEDFSKIEDADSIIYPKSIYTYKQCTYAMLKINRKRFLGIFLKTGKESNFEGQRIKLEDETDVIFCPLSNHNANTLRKTLPYTAPSSLSNKITTIGLGDRLGLAGPGQIGAISQYFAFPVLAQQSVRELELTGRSYEEVLDSATWAVFQEGFTNPWGADGDHLKTESWVKKAVSLGYTMITADISEYINDNYNSSTEKYVMNTYSNLNEKYRRRIEQKYLNLRVELDTKEVITFNHENLARTVMVYREAVVQANKLYKAALQEAEGGSFDFELSIDETSMPTTPQAHIFIVLECKESGIHLNSLAPKFVGEFQKGIDYIGELTIFEKNFSTHAAIARKYGHRLSIHSGSDKFSVFPIIGQHTRGRFHLKTAGTHWLEALSTISIKNPSLFRSIYKKAVLSFENAKQYYHVSTEIHNIPVVDNFNDSQLSVLFENPDVRQLLHITYGELLKDSSLKEKIFTTLKLYIEDYWTLLKKHIERHFELLGVKKV